MNFIKEHKAEILLLLGALVAGILSFLITIAVYNPENKNELAKLQNINSGENIVATINDKNKKDFSIVTNDKEKLTNNKINYEIMPKEINEIGSNVKNEINDDLSKYEQTKENLKSESPIVEISEPKEDLTKVETSSNLEKTEPADISENIEQNIQVENNEQQNEIELATLNKEENSNDELIAIEAIGKNAIVENMLPISGEIILEFAKDKLVYSETLDEWIIHLGVDILGEEAQPVKAVADGVIESVKMDPRYGNTIIIKHNENFKTVYSNLSTLELVFVGKEIKRGDIISGVGKGFGFESKEGPHVHFEIIKDEENIDPIAY